jgi:signal transduction histidine kinase
MQNLLSNSLKFSKGDTSPVINVYAERVKGDQLGANPSIIPSEEYCKISVADNGIGFDEAYAEKIFVIFQRLHSNHLFEGTGIGLSICKKIVEKHNGTITATSIPDKGSIFSVVLPFSQPITNGTSQSNGISTIAPYLVKNSN